PNMGTTDLENFKKAYHEDGYNWLWGGETLDDGLRSLANKTRSTTEFKDPGLTDDTIITLSNLSDNASDELTSEMETLKLPPAADPKNIAVPFKIITSLFCRLISTTYAFALAHASGVKTFGTLPGVRFHVDKPVNIKYNEINIHKLFDGYIDFCDGLFGVKRDPEGRNFQEFRPDLSCTILLPKPTPVSQPATSPVSQPSSVPSSLPEKKQALEFIYVAGFDFSSSGIDFFKLCSNRMEQTIRLNPIGQPLLFHLFDFGSGEVSRHEVSYQDDKSEVVVHKHEDQFDKVSSRNYDQAKDDQGISQSVFRDEKKNVMTILEVYKRILKIGESSPGQLMELSFFSDANEKGPQLLNYHDPAAQNDFTLPDNHEFIDPSAEYDFIPPLMNDVNRDHFQKAWHPDGYSWVWGYKTSDGLLKLLKSIIDSPDYHAGIPLDTVITLKNPTPLLRRILDRLEGKKPAPGKLYYKFGFILHMLSGVLKSSYMYHLARISQRNVFGGLPGTFAGPESGNEFNLLGINPAAYGKYIDFFKDNFDIKTDPEKRGYGKYIPD
ncbi:MAG TPA: hypothetical protein VFJ43_14275, partial [Bacteroidia bacterium]|nr:hypothetical protein [Bacteroidia bacterium]